MASWLAGGPPEPWDVINLESAVQQGDCAKLIQGHYTSGHSTLQQGDLAVVTEVQGSGDFRLRISEEDVTHVIRNDGRWRILRPWSRDALRGQLRNRGILVSNGRGYRRRLDWPEPHTVDNCRYDNLTSRDNHNPHKCAHLQMGITLRAAKDFLISICFPVWYLRDAEFVEQNGKHVRGEENGYDLAKQYECFSVVEVLFVALTAAGYPRRGLGEFPLFFLSHAQSETWRVTAAGIRQGAQDKMPWHVWFFGWLFGWLRRTHPSETYPAFVDYFCLCQCQRDFVRSKIAELIRNIQHTILLLAPPASRLQNSCGGDKTPVVLKRIFCIFEVDCTHSAEAELSGVCMSVSTIFHMLLCRAAREVKVEDAQARWDVDRNEILSAIIDQGALNDRLSNILQRFAAIAATSAFVCALGAGMVYGHVLNAIVKGESKAKPFVIALNLIITVCIFQRRARTLGVNAHPHDLSAFLCFVGSFTNLGMISNNMLRYYTNGRKTHLLFHAIVGLECSFVISVVGVVWLICKHRSCAQTAHHQSGFLFTQMLFPGGFTCLVRAAIPSVHYHVCKPLFSNKWDKYCWDYSQAQIVWFVVGCVLMTMWLCCQAWYRYCRASDGRTALLP